ncbi:hypothetical protein A3C37_02415 [Candidatus Peribacteria bacterium RIFCSPHIGHO2_02_FULL_53_20]|nr:MAG: hypothetical protein A3C37_02415 [Candidatus Peribacteria bacterium RIFCSPHIGHO2_02_FULL_53_20]OGJ67043.1 MAG: hypothetical protein A3B61_00875 [Candidatus Peribacteria bacterium RIFCSPLOWO2_01_FULL_53_10]OGJ73046.1 MAG: hypothetical protein A3G69_04235 [Candidatus Peribacteria bacterium RIFCSPLOWO2_12_FULL_53_10]
MIRYQFFPRSVGINEQIQNIIDCFNAVEDRICSPQNTLSSNEVLTILRDRLLELPMQVEKGKTKGSKIPVPVLFGINNKIDQHFDADALSSDGKIVLEVEAGRAVTNYQFLKDIFQACMMYGVEYLVLAVRNDYRKNDDFKRVYSFLETLYISNRLHLPLKGILVIGY